jgi:hypothetical protein
VFVTNQSGSILSQTALVTVPAQRLQIGLRVDVVLVRWPTNDSSLVLETSVGVGSNQTWNTFPGPIHIFGKQNVVTAETTNRLQFFRLRKP